VIRNSVELRFKYFTTHFIAYTNLIKIVLFISISYFKRFNMCHIFLNHLYVNVFQVLPRGNLVLTDGATGHITVTLTIPFFCPKAYQNCPLFVLAYIPDDVNQDTCEVTTLAQPESDDLPCGAVFLNSDIMKPKNISITAIPSGLFQTVNREFAVILRISRPSHPFLHDNLLNTVRVTM